MPRPIWSGAISFGLISIPVRLFPAVRRQNVSFKQLDGKSGARIKQKRVSADTGEEVPYDEIVKGYEITRDNFVVVTDEELSALDAKKSRTIDISEFVHLSEIDPVFFDSAYIVAPAELSAKAYQVLTQAMENSDMVAISTFVMRTKQYLAAVRAVDGKLMLSTMVYGDEVADASEIDDFEHLEGIEVKPAELAMAEQLIESLTEEFDASKHEDVHRHRVLELIQAKADGDELVFEKEEAPDDNVIDLADALEASVAAAKAARERHPTSSPGETEASADENAAETAEAAEASESKTKKATAKKAAKKAPVRKSA